MPLPSYLENLFARSSNKVAEITAGHYLAESHAAHYRQNIGVHQPRYTISCLLLLTGLSLIINDCLHEPHRGAWRFIPILFLLDRWLKKSTGHSVLEYTGTLATTYQEPEVQANAMLLLRQSAMEQQALTDGFTSQFLYDNNLEKTDQDLLLTTYRALKKNVYNSKASCMLLLLDVLPQLFNAGHLKTKLKLAYEPITQEYILYFSQDEAEDYALFNGIQARESNRDLNMVFSDTVENLHAKFEKYYETYHALTLDRYYQAQATSGYPSLRRR